MIDNLLRPGKLGSLELNNRIIYSAMSFDLNHHNGFLMDCEIESLVYRAKQEYAPGLINFPAMGTTAPSKTGANDMATIFDETSMLMAKKAVERVKKHGVKVMVQCGGGYSNPGMGPSDRIHTNTGKPIKAMTVGEIEAYIESMAKVAKLRVEAGFDVLEIHACTGKFLSTFLSPYTNQRNDQYGGSVYNRARIVIEVLQEARKAVGASVPICIRLSVDDLIGSRGLTIEDGKNIAKYIAPYVDAIQPSVGFNEFKWTISPAYFYQVGYVLPYTQAIKEAVGDEAMVIAMGKLGEPTLAEQVVATGKADFVCLGRPLFVDPHWITKAAKGESQKILKCIGCVNCFMENDRREIFPPQRSCTLNPGNLREEEFNHLKPAEKPKKILVIGGGLAGIEAASTLAKRGHVVTLCEKEKKLGGQWLVAAHGKEKVEYRTLLPYKIRELQENSVIVRLNQQVDKAYLAQCGEEFDEIVLATGAVPKELPLPYPLGNVTVVQGNDVLMERVQIGENVVVIGARFVGMEVAIKLAQAGKKVALVDQDEIGKSANPRLAGVYRNRMVDLGVYMYPECPVRRIDAEGVEITHMHLPLLLKAETVVLAIGTKPVDDLKAVLDEMNLKYHLIGDCKRIGDALLSIRDGAEIGRLL